MKGYVENLPDGRVKVVAEGEEKNLEILKEAIGEFSGFFKLVREGETDERLDTTSSDRWAHHSAHT